MEESEWRPGCRGRPTEASTESAVGVRSSQELSKQVDLN